MCSIADRIGERTPVLVACSDAPVPGPVIHRGGVGPHLAEPASSWNCAAQSRDTFQSCRNKAYGNPLPQWRVTKLTQEKTQRVFKGEGNGTRFVRLCATKQRARNAGRKFRNDMEPRIRGTNVRSE